MIIRQSEVWLINLDPTVGSEMKKIRPCIVINDDNVGILPSKTVVPISGWNDIYAQVPWMILLEATPQNGLSKHSAADAFQIRNVSHKRFVKKVGSIDEHLLFSIHQAVVKTLNIGYEITT